MLFYLITFPFSDEQNLFVCNYYNKMFGYGKQRDGIFLGGVGSDIFGEEGTARVVPRDRNNAYLLQKYIREYH